MSITAPIPALQGGKDTIVKAEGQALLVRRPHEETHIPLEAVARVVTEGRTVTIELTSAPDAVTVHVHRVWDVDEAAAVAFAEAVNGALPERTAAVAGADLVTGERLYQPSYRRWLRGIRRGSLYASLATVGLCVPVGLTGTWVAVLAILMFAFFAIPVLALGVWLLYGPVEEHHLRKHGVRIPAVRLRGERGSYAYPDPGGVVRTVRHSVQAWSIEAAYDPRDPGRVVPLLPRGRRILESFMALLVLGLGLLPAAGVVATVVAVFIGAFDEPA
ncbi:hypothetical protein ACFY8P_05455 [Streptomyces sp. NPDC012693]|jgi:hypothetical protein|uniref:hypothetical protein n=1 Tax=unclassified Streptomyces TaxID=2593676 RepID=UPI002030C937|nr:hypothetical protein [Streptomyces sp. MSC1_001]